MVYHFGPVQSRWTSFYCSDANYKLEAKVLMRVNDFKDKVTTLFWCTDMGCAWSYMGARAIMMVAMLR